MSALAVVATPSCSLQQPIQSASQSQAAVGKPAPDFIGTDLDGKPIRLAGFRGKPILLSFWASWCGPCRHEEPSLLKVSQDLAPQGLQLVGVTMRDNLEAARIYRDEFKVPYPSLFDQAARLAYAYDVDAPPAHVFIDARGIVKFKLTGELTEAGLRELIHRYLGLG